MDEYEKARTKGKRMNPNTACYGLDPGNAWNPLKKWPRNGACFCGSGVKHKKCCSEFVGEFTTAKAARTVEKQWDDVMAGRATFNVRNPDEADR